MPREILKQTELLECLNNDLIKTFFGQELNFLSYRTLSSDELYDVSSSPPDFSPLKRSVLDFGTTLVEVLNAIDIVMNQISLIINDFVSQTFFKSFILNIVKCTTKWPSAGAVNAMIFILYLVANAPDTLSDHILEVASTMIKRKHGILSNALSSLKQYNISRVVRSLQEEENKAVET
ncbi:hypothetical protein GEMRC1_013053 [Eukaryota sp. GEM-RC1]